MKRAHAYLLAFALQLALAPWFVHDWDGFVFLESAQDLLSGVTPYERAQEARPYVFLEDSWPPVNSWWAYPPLELLLIAPAVGLAKLASADPAVARLGLKLPFVLGNLALAYVGGRLVAALASERAAERRVRAERLLLFNPFLVFIAAVWGMFDATMMALLLLSVLLLHERRHSWGGVAFGLAALVKVFPLFVSPVYMLYVAHRDGWPKAARFVAAAVATASAVCLPFFLRDPAGFLHQTVGMHFLRSPQGFALVSFPLQLQNVNNLLGTSIPIAPLSVVMAVSGTLLIVAMGILLVAHARTGSTRALLGATLVTFLVVLLVNKVVNEQYLVMPIALLAVVVALDDRDDLARRALRAFTWGGLVSSLLIGLHFLTFVPADVAARWIPARPDETVQAIADRTDLPVLVVFSIPHALAIACLVPALVFALRYVLPVGRAALRDVARAAHGRIARIAPPRVSRALAVAIVAFALVAPPVASGVLALPHDEAPRAALSERGLVLARYDLAIANPSHDPDVRDGFWSRGPYPRPADGFYAATTGKVERDLATLRDAGVDVVLVSYSAGNRLRLETFLDAADDAGLRAAPVLDVSAPRHCPDSQRLPPSEVGARAVELAAECARRALAPFAGHPAAFRVGGENVLVLLNATSLALADLPDAFLVAGLQDADAPRWADAAFVMPPMEGPLDDFRSATATLARRSTLPVASAFDSTWSIPPSAYETTWADAHALGAAWVVVPWNLHRDGGALEPLYGGDDALIAATRAHAARLQTL